MNNTTSNTNTTQASPTMGSMMGEIVWLMSQSPIHKLLAISDLEWLLMPPILLSQYKLFYNDSQPVGVALWAYLSPEGEARFKADGRIAPQDWGNDALFDAQKGIVSNPGGTLWLIELIAPFHTSENQQRDLMMSDLLSTAFQGKSLKLQHVNPATGQSEEMTLKGKPAAENPN